MHAKTSLNAQTEVIAFKASVKYRIAVIILLQNLRNALARIAHLVKSGNNMENLRLHTALEECAVAVGYAMPTVELKLIYANIVNAQQVINAHKLSRGISHVLRTIEALKHIANQKIEMKNAVKGLNVGMIVIALILKMEN